jgi:predicted acylesterase/phospholipase RssA
MQLKFYHTVLNISGGATKISGLFGGARAILENTKVDLITGISSGALLTVPLALGLYEELEKSVLTIKMSDMFKVNPFTKKAGISPRAVWRVLTGEPSLGTTNIPDTLSKLVTPQRFDCYKYGNYPDIKIGVVDFVKGEMLYYFVKDLNYTEYITLVTASTSIPLIHGPVYYEDKILYDGGVRDHIATVDSLMNHKPLVTYNIYSRPQDNKILNLDWKPTSIVSVLDRTEQIRFTELEKRSDMFTELLLKEKNTVMKNVYLPKVLNSLFDINKDRLQELYIAGYERGNALFQTA